MMEPVLIEPEDLLRAEAELDESRSRIAEARALLDREEPRAKSLQLLVDGMRGLLGIEPPPPSALEKDFEALKRGARTILHGGSKMTYGGRLSIPAVILDVLGPDETDLDTIYARVCAHDAYAHGKKPSRGSVTNRLNDMAKRDEIIKVSRNAYKSLAPNGATENPPEPGGPNPGVQLEAEKPPAEEMVLPQPGHPYGEGSAKAASRF